MKTEREKMLAGELYDAGDSELKAARFRARRLCRGMNSSPPHDEAHRRSVCRQLFATGGHTVTIEPPFHCDYGSNTSLGRNVYFNFDCVILDVCCVLIGDFTLLGPGVHVYTANHPMDAQLRRTQEFGQPVTIGTDVWIGGRAIVCPGVTVGDRSVVGAGSVVTRDIPSDSMAVGNPARVIRQLD